MDKKIYLLLILGLFLFSSVTADLIDDQTSYYKLDETSGAVIDSHGTNDGTNYGATRGVTGKVNNGFDFDGSNDYVSNSHNFGDSNEISLSFWVKTDDVNSEQVILGLQDSVGTRYNFLVKIINGKYLLFVTDENLNQINGEIIKSVSTNWEHFVITYNNGEI